MHFTSVATKTKFGTREISETLNPRLWSSIACEEVHPSVTRTKRRRAKRSRSLLSRDVAARTCFNPRLPTWASSQARSSTEIMLRLSNISKTSASVSSGFQTREKWWIIVFECLKLRWNTKHEFLKLLLQQKKISLNYHLNRFSQFNYYIWDVKYAWTSKKCVWCAWSYDLIAALWQFLNIQQLRSRYLAVCQLRANTLLRKANGRVQI